MNETLQIPFLLSQCTKLQENIFMHLINFILLWCLIDSFSFNLHWYKDIFASSFILACLWQNFSWQVRLFNWGFINFSPWFFDRPTAITLLMEIYRWRGNSFSFFVHQKLKEILIWYGRIILPASKDRLICKIQSVWLKNWARHTHLNFEV